MAGSGRLGLQKYFRKPMANNVGGLGHEIRHFSPFVRQQVMLQLGVNRPLGVYLSSVPGDEDAEQFDVPCRWVGGVFTGRGSACVA